MSSLPPDDNKPERKKKQGEHNPSASLQQKLRNHAKATGEEVALVLIRYLNERFLYRLSLSPYRDRFVLRGATLFTVWDKEPHRATRDIDLLASGDNSAAAMRQMVEAICAQPVETEDGITFLPETLHIEERAEGRIYQGLHLEMAARLGTAQLRLEIDIAFGEAVTPPAQEIELPTLLDKPAPRLRAYQKETAIAEKCQALVSLGLLNTRMKDFYDLWYLSRAYEFEGMRLMSALQSTFTRRETVYPADGLPLALTDTFASNALKQQQWRAFLGKSPLRKGVAELVPLITQIRAFLQPPLQALAEGTTFRFHWSPEAGWGDFTARANAALEEMTADAERLGLYEREENMAEEKVLAPGLIFPAGVTRGSRSAGHLDANRHRSALPVRAPGRHSRRRSVAAKPAQRPYPPCLQRGCAALHAYFRYLEPRGTAQDKPGSGDCLGAQDGG